MTKRKNIQNVLFIYDFKYVKKNNQFEKFEVLSATN